MKKGAVVFWLLHLLLDGLLGFLFYQWLQIPDQKIWQVGVTLLSGIMLLFVTLWLNGATFAFFGSAETVGGAWKQGLRRLPLFAAWALVFGVVLTVAARWPWVWVIAAAVLLPLAGLAVNGNGLAAYRRWWYWVAAVVLLVVGIYLPLQMIQWVPGVTGLALQMASFAVRAGVGYLLFVTAWLMLAYVSVGGRPVAAHPRTVGLP